MLCWVQSLADVRLILLEIFSWRILGILFLRFLKFEVLRFALKFGCLIRCLHGNKNQRIRIKSCQLSFRKVLGKVLGNLIERLWERSRWTRDIGRLRVES